MGCAMMYTGAEQGGRAIAPFAELKVERTEMAVADAAGNLVNEYTHVYICKIDMFGIHLRHRVNEERKKETRGGKRRGLFITAEKGRSSEC